MTLLSISTITQIFRFESRNNQLIDLWKIGLLSSIKGQICQVRFYAFNLKIIRYKADEKEKIKKILPTSCRVNKAMSHQVSVVVRLINGRCIMMKIFSNCSIQLTGCKEESDWVEASNILKEFIEETMAKELPEKSALSDIIDRKNNCLEVINPKKTSLLYRSSQNLIDNYRDWIICGHDNRIVRMEYKDIIYLPPQGVLVQSYSDNYYWSLNKIARHNLLCAFPLFEKTSSAFAGILLGPKNTTSTIKQDEYKTECKTMLITSFEKQLPKLMKIKSTSSLITYITRFISKPSSIHHLKFRISSELSNSIFSLRIIDGSNRLCMVNGLIKELPFRVTLSTLQDYIQSCKGLVVNDQLLNIYASFINDDTKTLSITVEIENKHNISFYYYSKSNKISVLGSKQLDWFHKCSQALINLLKTVTKQKH